MDNLTHTMVGLMMARCGLERTTVRGAGMMMLAANVPDIDAVTWFDRVRYLEHHRSYTHALPMAPLMAFLPIFIVRARLGWGVYAAALAGVVSHDLLDFTNPYGIQLFLPISAERVGLDITNLFDLWIWLVLLIGVLAPALGKMVNAEIGAKPSPKLRTGWAWFALIAFLLYDGARFAAHERAIGMLASHLYEGSPPRQVFAVPASFANPFEWKGVVEGNVNGMDFAEILPVNVTQAFNPAAGKIYYESPPGVEIAEARKHLQFQVMLKFSRAPFWKVTPLADGSLVQLIDLRFGSPDRPGFAAAAVVVP